MGKRDFGFFGVGMISGLVMGGVLALLFAPASGEMTRRRIATGAGNAWDSAGRAVDASERVIGLVSSRVEEMLSLEERNVRRKLEELRADIEKLTPSKA